jgi:hypothetical protein
MLRPGEEREDSHTSGSSAGPEPYRAVDAIADPKGTPNTISSAVTPKTLLIHRLLSINREESTKNAIRSTEPLAL